ncbi:hypothetical protein MMMDOFMJ_4736 [Methylobacterium gnaphalii]|nr:hypothetical protein MMMDOFMJ_4736 [Methylobacterium gnaphalii]
MDDNNAAWRPPFESDQDHSMGALYGLNAICHLRHWS